MGSNQSSQARTTTAPAGATTWTLDPAHSSAEFAVRHMMIATVRGKMNIRSGTIAFDAADPAASTIEAEIEAGSINTGTADRDAHLRSADFLDAEAHPTLRFASTAVRPVGGDEYEVEGDLTIRGVTRPVVLKVEKEGEGRDPWGGWRAGVTATTTLDRREWGLTWNMALEAGGVLVADKVKVTLNLQAVRKD